MPDSPPARRYRRRQTAPPVWDAVRKSRFVRGLTSWLLTRRHNVGGYALSAFVHLMLALVLAAIVIQQETVEELFTVLASSDTENQELLKVVEIPTELNQSPFDSAPEQVSALDVADVASPLDVDINDRQLSLDVDDVDIPNIDLSKLDSHVGGRSKKARTALVAKHGGNKASERAVASGLKWLAKHQSKDGSWSFHHVTPECGDSCTQPGTLRSTQMGATGLALMAFLGAGHTHTKGEYQKRVERGITYLLKNQKLSAEGGDLRGTVQRNAGMYTQGIASIALCEAYALTEDKRLKVPAQMAIKFILQAQDTEGGGWRYKPGDPGDTSVVGWQVMALVSGKASRLRVPSRHFSLVKRFLYYVQTGDGAKYGYIKPSGKPSTTAIGLLCRMYLGWRRDKEALQRGVAYLSKVGPSKDDMYYNYYATQVLHHWGGKEWKQWNAVMRDQLVDTQRQDGHAAGSWDVADKHGGPGGRLYMTCLCVMTLEVYYRHLPLYQRQSVTAEY